MYHLELRQFPHNLCRFNLNEQELAAIVEPWTREPWLEIEERRWLPDKAHLTILEGPQIPLSQLTMGRGWRTAERQSKDVTERVLAAAKQAVASASAPSPASDLQAQPQPDPALASDSLSLELLAALGDGPAPLSAAWRRACERYVERSPSECLELAERAVRSLLATRLIVLTVPGAGDFEGGASAPSRADLPETQVEPALRALDSWLEHGSTIVVGMRRA